MSDPRRRRRRPIELTGLDGADHVVSQDAIAASTHVGRYVAMCGQLVHAAALVTPPGPPCAACRAALDARPARAPAPVGPGPGWWAHLVARLLGRWWAPRRGGRPGQAHGGTGVGPSDPGPAVAGTPPRAPAPLFDPSYDLFRGSRR